MCCYVQCSEWKVSFPLTFFHFFKVLRREGGVVPLHAVLELQKLIEVIH